MLIVVISRRRFVLRHGPSGTIFELMKRLSVAVLFLLMLLSFSQTSHGWEFCNDCCDSDHCADCLLGSCCLVQPTALPTDELVVDMTAMQDEIIPPFRPALGTSECIYPPDQPPRFS